MALTGKSAASLVRFCPIAEMEYDDESGLWIAFKSGKRAMVLRRRRNRCIFQSARRACAAYAARPQTCRTFPYNITIDGGEASDISLNKVMNCNAVKCKHVDIDAIITEVKKENKEDAEYHRLVKRWNRLDNGGGVKDFLAFIGF
jgi:Fe-S-cluster containining protein